MVVDLAATRHAVRGDATRLQQIFWNLINNAQKFTPPGGTITVRSRDVAPDNGHAGGPTRVCVEVVDTGVGIEPSMIPKLFDAFEQGEVRAARQHAGLGLGLAISRRLAEAHGGTITGHSDGPGRGATFRVELPAAESPALAWNPHETGDPAVSRGAAALSILLVEDHEPTLEVLTRLLQRLGHSVTGVKSVASAKAAAAFDGFDLLVSDLGLPDGSGLDVMRHLKDKFNGRAIALTGYGMESDVAASRGAGFTEHLIKPVDLATLDAAIRRVAATPGHAAVVR
jgi:CheY-like chemotaxis protein